MLKKIMKAALAASLVIGFSAAASAEMMAAKVSGDVHAYMGQYTTGAEGYTAHFKTATESHINVSGSSGSISGFLQVESRSNAVNNTQQSVKWTSDALSVQLGTVSNGVSCTYAISSGLGTTTTAGLGTYVRCWGYHETDGLQVQYAIPAIKGAVQLSIFPLGDTTGQSMAIGATGTLADMVQFRFNQTTDTNQDYTVSGSTATADSAMHVGFKMGFGAMSISLDLSTKTPESKADASSTAIQFRMADLGPGSLAVTVASDEYKLAGGDPDNKTSNTALAYLIPMDKGARFDVFYAAKTTTPEGGSATTLSTIGGGLNLAF
jgi:hypothetical protein